MNRGIKSYYSYDICPLWIGLIYFSYQLPTSILFKRSINIQIECGYKIEVWSKRSRIKEEKSLFFLIESIPTKVYNYMSSREEMSIFALI